MRLELLFGFALFSVGLVESAFLWLFIGGILMMHALGWFRWRDEDDGA